ncbi:hypothetical protein C8R44DRAFT_727026 [Mycena epipterygia]|nr:hypothetical protein C8R44DRAFT_727026 [Mycena epipterygia]
MLFHFELGGQEYCVRVYVLANGTLLSAIQCRGLTRVLTLGESYTVPLVPEIRPTAAELRLAEAFFLRKAYQAFRPDIVRRDFRMPSPPILWCTWTSAEDDACWTMVVAGEVLTYHSPLHIPLCQMNPSLPPDVLDEIFTALVLASKNKWHHIARDRRRVALVCTEWKAVAYNNAALWSNIAIHRFTSQAHVDFCLSNTKIRDLAVLIDTHPHTRVVFDKTKRGRSVTSRPMDHILARLLPKIHAVSTRITILTIVCRYTEHWDAIANDLKHMDARRLHDLRLYVTPPGAASNAPHLFPTSHMLSYITVDAVGPCVAPNLYRGLTSIKLSRIANNAALYWSELHAGLSATARLETLVLEAVCCRHTRDDPGALTLVALTTLAVAYDDNGGVDFLALIAAPALVSLRVNLLNWPFAVAIMTGHHLFSVAIHIELAWWNCDAGDVERLVRSVPNAVSLDLHTGPDDATDVLVMVLQTGVRFSRVALLKTAKVVVNANDALVILTSLNEGPVVANRLISGDGEHEFDVGPCLEWRAENNVATASEAKSRNSYALFDMDTRDVIDSILTAFILAPESGWQHVARDRAVAALVCRDWKALSYSNPLLWNNIAIHRFTSPTYVVFCLERSGFADLNLLLDTQFYSRVCMDESKTTHVGVRSKPIASLITRVLPTLESAWPRVTTLNVVCTNVAHWMALTSSLAIAATQNIANASILAHIAGAPSVAGRDLFEYCSSLRTLTLDGVGACGALEAYHNLTSLILRNVTSTIGRPSWDGIRVVLLAARELEVLEIDGINCAYPGIVQGAVVLPKLSSLTVAYEDDENAALLGLISAPGLQSLSIILAFDASLEPVLFHGGELLSLVRDLEIGVDACSKDEMDHLRRTVRNASSLDFRRSGHALLGVFAASLAGGHTTIEGPTTTKFSNYISHVQASFLLRRVTTSERLRRQTVVGRAGPETEGEVEWMLDASGTPTVC